MDVGAMNISHPHRAAASGEPIGRVAAALRRRRGPILTGGVLLAAIATTAVTAVPTALAASPSPSPAASGTPAGNGQLAPPGVVRWAVEPATATAPIPGQSTFNYTNIKPGATITDHVAIFNYSQQAASFEIYGTDATGTTASGELLLMPGPEKPKDIGSWVSFPHTTRLSVIIPGDRGVIEPFTIAVPRQATPGDHTGAIAAAVSTEVATAKGQLVTKEVRIAIPLEMRVFGPLQAGMRVESISAGFRNNLNPVGDGSATVSFVVLNTGNIRLAGSQSVSVTGPFGVKATVPGKLLATVLPGDSVEFTTTVHGLYPAGPLTAHVRVSPGAPPGAAALATPLAMVTGTASLFAVPWAVLVVLILLVGGAVGLWQLLRYRQRRLQQTMSAVAENVRRETERRLLDSKDTSAGTPTGQ
jgi:hypothetical protein